METAEWLQVVIAMEHHPVLYIGSLVITQNVHLAAGYNVQISRTKLQVVNALAL